MQVSHSINYVKSFENLFSEANLREKGYAQAATKASQFNDTQGVLRKVGLTYHSVAHLPNGFMEVHQDLVPDARWAPDPKFSSDTGGVVLLGFMSEETNPSVTATYIPARSHEEPGLYRIAVAAPLAPALLAGEENGPSDRLLLVTAIDETTVKRAMIARDLLRKSLRLV